MSEEATPDEEHLLRNALGAMGGRGSRWIARFLRTEVRHRDSVHAIRFDEAVAQLVTAFPDDRSFLVSAPAQDGSCILFGLLGSGGFNLNPAVVSIWIAPSSTGGCSTRIRAAAKEGLINQRTADKAIAQLEAALTH